MKIAIILPFYNHWNLSHTRLFELYKYVQDNCFIVLVNDCSTEVECETGVAWWQKQVHKQEIYYIKNKENLGFGKSMNLGAKIAQKHGA